MVPLVAYAGILVVGFVWIFCDAETAYIFDVFGKSFKYVWFESGRRWASMVSYGCRLLALLALIGSTEILAYHIVFAAARVSSRGAAFVVLTVVSLLLIPWIRIACHLRFRLALRTVAGHLTPVVHRFSELPDVSQVLNAAEYVTDRPWTAWHPQTAPLGKRNIIEALEYGVEGMRVGGRR